MSRARLWDGVRVCFSSEEAIFTELQPSIQTISLNVSPVFLVFYKKNQIDDRRT